MVGTEAVVHIVDDDEAARVGLVELLESVELGVQTHASAQGFLSNFSNDQTGCILLDVRMPGMSGLKLQNELNKRNCRLPIIFLTGHGDVPMAVEALRNGAFDFVEKPSGGQFLLDKVFDAIEESSRQQDLSDRTRALRTMLASLTPKEEEVLGYVKQGKRVKIIAMEMGLSRKTVDWHLAMIREKLGVESTGELMLRLHAAGALPPAS